MNQKNDPYKTKFRIPARNALVANGVATKAAKTQSVRPTGYMNTEIPLNISLKFEIFLAFSAKNIPAIKTQPSEKEKPMLIPKAISTDGRLVDVLFFDFLAYRLSKNLRKVISNTEQRATITNSKKAKI